MDIVTKKAIQKVNRLAVAIISVVPTVLISNWLYSGFGIDSKWLQIGIFFCLLAIFALLTRNLKLIQPK